MKSIYILLLTYLLISNYDTYITTKTFNLTEPFNYMVIQIRRILIGRRTKLYSHKIYKNILILKPVSSRFLNFLNTSSSSLSFFANIIFLCTLNKVYWDDFSDIVDHNQVFTFRNVLNNLLIVHGWAKEICKACFVAGKKVSAYSNSRINSNSSSFSF